MAGRARRAAFGLAILSAALVSSAGGADRGTPPAATPFDLIIEHGHVIDGTGAPWYAADLGIRGGRIAFDLPRGEVSRDAVRRLYVSEAA